MRGTGHERQACYSVPDPFRGWERGVGEGHGRRHESQISKCDWACYSLPNPFHVRGYSMSVALHVGGASAGWGGGGTWDARMHAVDGGALENFVAPPVMRRSASLF